MKAKYLIQKIVGVILIVLSLPQISFGSEAELVLPQTSDVGFNFWGLQLNGSMILTIGLGVCVLAMIYGYFEYRRLKMIPAHQSMLDVSKLIYGTCLTYLMQQGKLLLLLETLIGATMLYYFYFLKEMPLAHVALILLWSLIGIGGAFSVAWFGMLINNIANSRTAFAALRGKVLPVSEIPTRSGMSIGVLLISVELTAMIVVLKFVDPSLAGVCFIGFAIGESLGASVLRICGGIFTKIADIGSDMMKIVFKIKEDDARNPGVIADCTGDNAGDSVGPTADGFETYGVTGVALITFICLAVFDQFKADFIIWIFAMRILMIPTALLAHKINAFFTRRTFNENKKFNFEHPLTSLVWMCSILGIVVTFLISYVMLHGRYGDPAQDEIWWKLATIISCGTIAGALIPEFTRIFTSMHSAHCKEVVTASKEGGAGLTILSGIVAGNFSAFWKGLLLLVLMMIAYLASMGTLDLFMSHQAIFAFGLVAFGMLGMGPVTIAVDSYGPVTDNAQSVFELSTIEQIPNISEEIKRDFGFEPDFVKGKEFLEENDGAGNTFKATAKPVLIGTAVVGATTMIFSLILMLQKNYDPNIFTSLSIVNAPVLLGLIAGGAVIYWFSGASMQAVTTGAYRAVDYIKKNIKLEGITKASQEDSNAVVKICTKYAQYGMINIFIAIFCFALAFACLNPIFFCAYLISIAVFGLFAAIYMANAGGCWDNAKKVVEVELKQKGTPLHDATVIGDIVGDPFKDTSSVALNPIIKFTTLFGILAVEIAVMVGGKGHMSVIMGVVFLLVALFFARRSFYGMRIESKQ